MVSQRKYDFDVFRGFLATGALFLSVLMLAFAATPETVLADSAAGQYTEPDFPQKPPANPPVLKDGAGESGSAGNSGRGDGGSGGGTGVSEAGGSAPDQAGQVGQGADGPGGNGAGGAAGSFNSGEPGSARSDSLAPSDSERAEDALVGGSGGGGNNLWVIAAFLLGLPLLLGSGYYLTGVYRGSRDDEEMRGKVREAVSGGKSDTAP